MNTTLPRPVPMVCLIVALTLSAVARAQEDELSRAFAALRQHIDQAEQQLRREPAYATAVDRADGYRHLLRSLVKGIEDGVLQDPDYPYFRILDFWLREGGDNPDQRYAFSPIRGGQSYRIWGTLGSASRIELQLYAGRAWDGSGRSVGYLNFEDLALNANGEFDIVLSATPQPGNWLFNPPEATDVFVRHVYSHWDRVPAGTVHIDRIGWEGARRSPQTPAELANGIHRAGEMFAASAATWPAIVQRMAEAREPNTLSAPHDTYARGGARGRWMSSGYFDLAPGQAMLVRMPATDAPYQAIQLTDRWFASLDYANNVSSLNAEQSIASEDGAYYFIIADEDPGHANWLDTAGHRSGALLLRWDGLGGTLAEHEFPSVQLGSIASLLATIPGAAAAAPATREATRAMRRRHLQRSSNR